jgi:AraC-like DNA-binding protein
MNSRAIVLKQLAALAKLETGRFYFGTKGPRPPAGAVFLPTVRVNIVLSGCRRLTLPLAGKATEADLRTGDVQVSERHTWEHLICDAPHEVLCIVPRGEYLRVVYYRFRRTGRGTMVSRSDPYHTAQPCSEALRRTVEALCACVQEPDHRAASHLLKALARLALEACGAPPDDTGHGLAEALFRNMQRWLENHYQDHIGREDVAEAFHVTPGYVSRLFHRLSGTTFIAVLTRQRIAFAKTLLAETNLKVYQVAAQCGFRNHVYFARRFRELCGTSPGRYRCGLSAASDGKGKG